MKKNTCKKSITRKEGNPWYTVSLDVKHDEIMRLRRKINKIKDKDSPKLVNLSLRLSESRRTYKKEIASTVSIFFENLHKINNEVDFWKVYSKSKSKKYEPIAIFENNASRTKEENEEMLGEQFIKKDEPVMMINLPNNKGLTPTDEKEMDRIIANLNNKKASGPDNVENRLIKILYHDDKNYLIELFNLLLKKKKIPSKWKVGKLIYFAKPNRKVKSSSDYRPIILLNNFCKIAEELIISRINKRLNEIDFYSDIQFGFKKKTSTVDALKSMINALFNCLVEFF